MSNNLFLDSLEITQKVFDYSFEEPIEQEILLADYDEPVFKIVKTNIEHSISQKYILDNKLVIDGYFKVSMYYQAKEKEILSVSTLKLPFQKQIDIDRPVFDTNFIYIQGDTQFVNTRAVNQTRIDIRGAYRLSVKVYSASEIEVITAINSKTVCGDDEKIEHFSLQGYGMRQFNLEDEIQEFENVKQIINISTTNTNLNTSIYKDKVNIKGEVMADIFYTKDDTNDIQTLRKTFLYNQIVDVVGINENNIAYTNLTPTSFSITQNSESQKISANLGILLETKSFKKKEIYAIKDAFSKTYESKSETKEVCYDKNLKSLSKTVNFTSEETISAGCTIVHQFCNMGEVKTYFEEGNLIAKSKINCYIIIKNLQNELECITKTEDVIIDSVPKSGKYDEYIALLKVSNIVTSINEDKLKIKANIVADGFIIVKECVKILAEFTEIEESVLEKRDEALILYYAQKGESLFDIARRYRISNSVILNENEIEDKILKEDKMLIISAFES